MTKRITNEMHPYVKVVISLTNVVQLESTHAVSFKQTFNPLTYLKYNFST